MQELGTVASIWRYPIKGLAGENLSEAMIGTDGIEGDRCSAPFVVSGHARAGKTYRGMEHNLLHTVADAATAQALAQERGVAIEMQSGSRYFYSAPISLVIDCWVNEVSQGLGRELDVRRWRPNLYAKAAADFTLSESDLIGSLIDAGSVVLRAREPIKRCVVTTYDVQTGEVDNDVLRYVVQERGNSLGVYCDVEEAGVVRPGDALRLRAR